MAARSVPAGGMVWPVSPTDEPACTSEIRDVPIVGPTLVQPSRSSIALPWVLVVAVSAYIFADKSGFLDTSAQTLAASSSLAGSHLLEVNWKSEPFVAVGVARWLTEANSSTEASSSSAGAHAAPEGSARTGTSHSSAASAGSASAAGSSAASASSANSEHSGHPQDALLFLFNTIVFGTLITQLTTRFHGLQPTVLLFTLGCLYSLVHEWLNLPEALGVFGRSYTMWMDIDPHLMLFTMLPALLTGDAMTLDTSVARRVAKQCVYLASVGVLVNAGITALFLWVYLPYDWSFLLCLTTGSILCATDPVAVVALLKELGASPTLTVQIQGESLLNDGTAIVLYTIAYNILKGEEYDFSDIVIFLVKTACCAWFLGMIIGYVFFLWICKASNKLDEHSSMIQVSLTLCCSYWSFIIAEGIFHISGVLSTVAAALVLAHYMWPHVVSKESMHTTWHMLEYLGNTIIFFLAGALTGKVMVDVQPVDYLHLCVIYVALIVFRFALLFCSRPILQRLEEDRTSVSIGEVLVMTWGGLRGAVGLVLAIQVTIDRAGGEISVSDANRVLFYVGGIAALTLVVNASTCPAIVNALGITKLPIAKRRMLMLIHRRLLEQSKEQNHPTSVYKAVRDMLNQMEHHIDADPSRIQRLSKGVSARMQSMSVGVKRVSGMRTSTGALTRISEVGPSAEGRFSTGTASLEKDGIGLCGSSSLGLEKVSSARRVSALAHNIAENIAERLHLIDHPDFQTMENLVEQHAESKMNFDMIPLEQLQLLGKLPNNKNVDDQEQDMLDLVQTKDLDPLMSRAMNEALLSVVRTMYARQIEAGEVLPGTTEAEVLMGSITCALNRPMHDLCDFEYIIPFVRSATAGGPVGRSTLAARISGGSKEDAQDAESLWCPCVRRLVESMVFQSVMVFCIVFNAIVILFEEEYRTEDNNHNLGWLVADIVFNLAFLIEFFLKLIDKKHQYFFDAWNLFDFSLVTAGVVGLTFGCLALSSGATQDSAGRTLEGQLARIARAFRVLRLMRLLRIVKYFRTLKNSITEKEETLQIRKHMEKLTILTCFVKGHMSAQHELIQYLGTVGKVDSVEAARCILQSKVVVYRAISMAVSAVGEEQQLDSRLLKEVNQVRESKAVAEELEKFVIEAHHHGIINSREAESLLHPLHEHMKGCMKKIRQAMIGGSSQIDKNDEADDEPDTQILYDAAGNPVVASPWASEVTKTSEHSLHVLPPEAPCGGIKVLPPSDAPGTLDVPSQQASGSSSPKAVPPPLIGDSSSGKGSPVPKLDAPTSVGDGPVGSPIENAVLPYADTIRSPQSGSPVPPASPPPAETARPVPKAGGACSPPGVVSSLSG